jgi:hypothetical protein
MSGSTLTPKEQAEQEDKQLLTENNQRIQEVMQLLSDGETRVTAKNKVLNAKDKSKQAGKSQLVFHPYKGKRTPVSQEASNYLALGDALELKLLTGQHNKDLQQALAGLAKKRVEILERRIKRQE